jgi:hypothetical protein
MMIKLPTNTVSSVDGFVVVSVWAKVTSDDSMIIPASNIRFIRTSFIF